MLRIPLVDLHAQYKSIKPEIDKAIQGVLDRGRFILGPEVESLERELAEYCGAKFAVAVASGTDAIELALRACGIGPGDEVITTAYSFFATAEAVVSVGAVPVFVDIDPGTYNLNPAELEDCISLRTKAILPVHLFGHPCEMDAIMRFARAHNLRVIEDCAQAIGARYEKQRVGSFGDAGALSFYPSKNLGGYGDGGMVVTSDPGIFERIRLLRTHGSKKKYHHAVVGKNSRLDELQAAVLRVKLRHLDNWNGARRKHAQTYAQLFVRYQLADVSAPMVHASCEHVYHLYTIRAKQRDRLRETLNSQDIACEVYYPSTLAQQPALASHLTGNITVTAAEAACREVLSLPMYPELTPELIEHIVKQLGSVTALGS